MYLTRFPINVTRRSTRRVVTSPYRMHAAIAGSFPQGVVQDESGRVLWRIDRSGDNALTLYIASPQKPSLVGLDEQIGWPDLEPQWETRDYEPFLQRVEEGVRYRFRLVANPTVSRSGISNERGASKRIPHLTILHQAAWLIGAAAYEEVGAAVPKGCASGDASRAVRNGFVVCRDDANALQLVVSNAEKRRFPQGEKGRTITLATAQYDGLLEVADAESLKHALRFGIGHAKGFGCGLMTLVPAEA